MAEIFQGRPAEEPVAVVDLIDDKTRLQDNHVGDHGIMGRVRVFGDVQIFLYEATHVREKRPMSTDPTAIFIGLNDGTASVGVCPAAVRCPISRSTVKAAILRCRY